MKKKTENNEMKDYNKYFYEKTLEDTWRRYEGYERLIDKFDNWLLKLCAGSFGLSFAFIDHFIDFASAKNIFLLELSWISFTLCLILSLLDFFITGEGKIKIIRNLWIRYENEVNEASKKELKDWSNTADHIITITNILLFGSGILCLILFIFRNIR